MKAIEGLRVIQGKLNAPKGQENKFGGYRYRSLEDICAAVKPLLVETETAFVMSDDIVQIGDRIYVRATATLHGDEETLVSATGWAREPASRKGMDDAQVTGATSSYARKYAANALFAIDDTKDADTMPPPDQTQKKAGQTWKPKETPSTKDPNKQRAYSAFLDMILATESIESLEQFIKDNGASITKELGGTEYREMLLGDYEDHKAKLAAQVTA